MVQLHSQYLAAGREQDGPIGISFEVEVDGIRFEVVGEFIYLGT